MDAFTLVRQVVLFAHTVAFAIALAAVLREDVALIKARSLDWNRLEEAKRTIAFALAALWVTGLALALFNLFLEGGASIPSPKLAAKLFVVAALTANGLALHTLAFPILRERQPQEGGSVCLPVALGAISSVSWLYASFIGVSRWVAPLMSFSHYVALYGLLLVVAIAFALMFVRPRLERLLLACS